MVTKLPGPEKFDKNNIPLLLEQCADFMEKYQGDLLPILMLNTESVVLSELVPAISTPQLTQEEKRVIVENIKRNIVAIQKDIPDKISALLQEKDDDIANPQTSFMMLYFVNKYHTSIHAIIRSATSAELDSYITHWTGDQPPSASQFTMKSKENLN